MISSIPDVTGADVTVMGLGLHGGGTGVTRYLVEQGARVTVTDLKAADELEESLNEIEDLEVECVLGEHRETDFSSTDLIVVNPAVPLGSPYLDVARTHGTPLESELNLFVKLCPANIIGITGSAGKSTTTSMTGHIMRASPGVNEWVGGNIGGTLLNDLEDISEDDVVVLEISSFQLLHLDQIHWSPSIAIVTNIFPNHLDRHDTFENYVDAKKTIVRHQSEGDLAILNAEDQTVMDWADDLHGDLWTFSSEQPVPRGAWVDNGTIYVRTQEEESSQNMISVDEVPVPGRFNLENAMAAILSSKRLSISSEAIEQGIRSFKPLPHHLEHVVDVNGVEFIDDSVSTTPESTISALKALEHRRMVVILGGYDKGVALDKLVRQVGKRTEGAVLIGDTAERLHELFETTCPGFPCSLAPDLSSAVRTAYDEISEQGGLVLLSTASASYDMFRNYQERGKIFKEEARRLDEE